MSKYIEVNDSVAAVLNDDDTYVVEDGIKLSVPSMFFVEAYFGQDLGVLPPRVCWISDGTPMSVLFERPPEKRVLTWEGEDYSVLMPWLLFMVSFKDFSTVTVSVHARNNRLYSLTDEIFESPLPCRDANGTIVDFSYEVNGPLGQSLEEIVQKVFEHMNGHAVPDEHVPSTWGEFEDMKELLVYWQDLDVNALLMETEYITSPLHSVEKLCERVSVSTDDHTSFSYLENIIRTLAIKQQNG